MIRDLFETIIDRGVPWVGPRGEEIITLPPDVLKNPPDVKETNSYIITTFQMWPALEGSMDLYVCISGSQATCGWKTILAAKKTRWDLVGWD